MSRISAEFGVLVKSFLDKNELTYRAAAFGSGISAAYWNDMSEGRVPSEDIIARMAQAYVDLDENALRQAAGYGPKMESMDPVEAVEFALRSQNGISDEGKKQILDFVRETQKRYSES
jgi:hypothetical protein